MPLSPGISTSMSTIVRRPVRADRLPQLLAAADRGDHADRLPRLEALPEPLAEDRMVVDDDDLDRLARHAASRATQ